MECLCVPGPSLITLRVFFKKSKFLSSENVVSDFRILKNITSFLAHVVKELLIGPGRCVIAFEITFLSAPTSTLSFGSAQRTVF